MDKAYRLFYSGLAFVAAPLAVPALVCIIIVVLKSDHLFQGMFVLALASVSLGFHLIQKAVTAVHEPRRK